MSITKLSNIGQMVTYNSILDKIEVHDNIEIIIEDDIIVDIGSNLFSSKHNFNCNNMLVTPGFVDSHTHPVFYNEREKEFSLRLNGASYQQIAEAGGGILNSVLDLRKATEKQLKIRVKKRMDRFLRLGTTTVECKSGYGLTTESELKSLKVIDEVNKEHDIDMVPTFMGAHAFPEEFKDDHDGYVDVICNEMIPAIAKQGIAVFNDVFCENGYFNLDQSFKILQTGKKYGLQPRMHADEFQESGSASLAAKVKSISADHLMKVSDRGIQDLANKNVIATLLPGTTFFLGEKHYAPLNKLKNAGVEIALASDYNPGSCNIQSMSFIITLACIYMKMNVLDAIKASTYNSARSLNLEKKIGSIEIGKTADIIVWNFERFEQIPYYVTDHPIQLVFKNGCPVITS